MLLVSSAVCALSMLRVIKTRRPTSTNYRLQHNSLRYSICDRMATRHLNYHRDGEWAVPASKLPSRRRMGGTKRATPNKEHTSASISMGTRRSPPTNMSVDYVQKFAQIFIAIFFKPSITGVTNSGAAPLPGTLSKWSHDVPKRTKLSTGESSSTTGSTSRLSKS